jgi:hypothetical protein
MPSGCLTIDIFGRAGAAQVRGTKSIVATLMSRRGGQSLGGKAPGGKNIPPGFA